VPLSGICAFQYEIIISLSLSSSSGTSFSIIHSLCFMAANSKMFQQCCSLSSSGIAFQFLTGVDLLFHLEYVFDMAIRYSLDICGYHKCHCAHLGVIVDLLPGICLFPPVLCAAHLLILSILDRYGNRKNLLQEHVVSPSCCIACDCRVHPVVPLINY